jgi:hypothetical protein
MVVNKAKGQQNSVSKLKLLAFALPLASWQSGLLRQTPNLRNGVNGTARGFESHTRLQTETSPPKAVTFAREKKRTADAARIRKFSIRLMAVKFNRRFHSDLSQLPDRL